MINRLKGWISSRFVARLLLYFAVIGLVPILVFSMITRNVTYNSVQQQLALQTENTVLGVSSSLSTLLDDYSAILLRLSVDPDVRRFVESGYQEGETAEFPSNQTMRALMRLYREARGRNNALAVHIVSVLHTDSLSTASVPANYLPPSNDGWGIFRMAAATQSAVLRTYDRSPSALPNVAFSMAMTVRGVEGELLGYVVFDVYHSVLEELLKEADLSYDLDIFISDNNRYLIHSTQEEDLRKLPQQMYNVVDSSAGEQIILRQETRDAMHVSSKLSAYKIWVVGEMSMDPVNQTNQYVRNAALLAAAVGIVLCILAAYLAWKDLSTPIHRMTNTFKQMESGDLSARVGMDERKDEFGVLGSRFDQMADEIEALIKNVEEKQRRLRISENSALQAQINPHFLYNTLDLIKWNAKLGNTEDVTKITVSLGKLLRAMANFEEDTVTVEEECNLIDRYLGIQMFHYGDRLIIHRDIPDSVKQLRIPKLILQPLVENSIVHGFDNRLGKCELRISASYAAPYLTFLIEDNGPGIEPELLKTLLVRKESSGSIGLQNVHRRSHLHGDESCGLQISSTLGVGTSVRLVLRTLDEHGRILKVGEEDV